jgi:hypothetical protein
MLTFEAARFEKEVQRETEWTRLWAYSENLYIQWPLPQFLVVSTKLVTCTILANYFSFFVDSQWQVDIEKHRKNSSNDREDQYSMKKDSFKDYHNEFIISHITNDFKNCR